MFCTQCGTGLREGDRYCPRCGKPVNEIPAPAGSGGLGQNAYAEAGYDLRRPLRRIMSQKKIGGVCAGFAQYFEVDVTLMRIIFIALLVLPPGVGAIVYLIAWVAMPRDI